MALIIMIEIYYLTTLFYERDPYVCLCCKKFKRWWAGFSMSEKARINNNVKPLLRLWHLLEGLKRSIRVIGTCNKYLDNTL